MRDYFILAGMMLAVWVGGLTWAKWYDGRGRRDQKDR